jgi:ABC-type dipeptide/oligopeptide/nickel transport system permease subunit
MQGKQSAHLGVWHLWLFPALAILSSVMLCHALAERHRTR